jgi:hypothetical protein
MAALVMSIVTFSVMSQSCMIASVMSRFVMQL